MNFQHHSSASQLALFAEAAPVAGSPFVVSTEEIDALIEAGAPVAIGVSGGKDSQAAAIAMFDYLSMMGHRGPRVLVHADLGSVEWNDSLPVCRELARYLGCELIVVRRKAGGLMIRWWRRWELSVQRYEALSTVTLVPCWSTPDMRFCTSELKTHPIVAELKRRFKGQTVINVTGIRRAESKKRSKATVADWSKDGRVINWRPILDWSTDEVFAEIDNRGIAPHPAYRDFGMSRVSCRFCIMSSISDLTAAAAQPETHSLYREMVDLEIVSTFAFQGARWLGDVAPDLLTPAQRERLAEAKSRALKRSRFEGEITQDMLYVKGWPTRMLTDSEADTLAEVRRGVSATLGLKAGFLDRDSIHERYAELIAERERKEAAK
jgi:3'-phosphoadenosine 5'-phosphosulfate sulfotransferase (PAPS reductase)/FAD synthetase